VKYIEPRPWADPEKAARRIVEIASTIEPVQDGRIYIELINQQVGKRIGRFVLHLIDGGKFRSLL
jgi:hypothetical protein